MAVYVVIGLFIPWWYAVAVAKEMHAQARDRRDDRIMAAYLQREDIRMHAWNLASIERVRQATVEEMILAAGEASGGITKQAAIRGRRR